MQVYVEPRAQWRQMYHEVWRIQRDFLYDPHAHGLDLGAAEKKYQPFADAVASRADLTYLFEEMLGELTLGHVFVGGPPRPDSNAPKPGLLGADYTVENGRYRFGRAAVLDARFNHGGSLADYIVDYLRRPIMSWVTAREGEDFSSPSAAIYGPKVMIINEFAGSGGDAMPWYFRKAGIGPLVGKRTWGGLVGIGGTPLGDLRPFGRLGGGESGDRAGCRGRIRSAVLAAGA